MWTWWPTGSACLRRPPGAGDRIEPARRGDGRGSAASPAAPAAGVPQPGVRNVANALTVLRLVLVPLFVVFLLAGGTGWRIAALRGVPVASVTDLLDGRIARRRGLITDFGKIADPDRGQGADRRGAGHPVRSWASWPGG